MTVEKLIMKYNLLPYDDGDDDVQTHPIIPAIEKSYQSALLLEAEVKHGCH